MNRSIVRGIDYKAKCMKDVKMKLKNLSMSEYKKSVVFHPEVKDSSGNVSKVAQFEYDLDVMFSCMIFDIENLKLTDENKETVEIKTGRDILENPGLNDLYLELTSVLIKMEARVDSKN